MGGGGGGGFCLSWGKSVEGKSSSSMITSHLSYLYCEKAHDCCFNSKRPSFLWKRHLRKDIDYLQWHLQWLPQGYQFCLLNWYLWKVWVWVPPSSYYAYFVLLLFTLQVRFASVFHQVIWIPAGTNCASLLADLLLYFYKMNFQTKW